MRSLVLMLVACGSPARGPIDTESFGKNSGAFDVGGLNHDGVELYRAGEHEAALVKFREAVARIPDPRYFFNLCLTLGELGQLEEACRACVAAFGIADEPNLPAARPRLLRQLADLEATAKARGTPLTCDRSAAR